MQNTERCSMVSYSYTELNIGLKGRIEMNWDAYFYCFTSYGLKVWCDLDIGPDLNTRPVNRAVIQIRTA